MLCSTPDVMNIHATESSNGAPQSEAGLESTISDFLTPQQHNKVLCESEERFVRIPMIILLARLALFPK